MSWISMPEPCLCGAEDCGACRPDNPFTNACDCVDLDRMDDGGTLEVGTCDRCGDSSYFCDGCELPFTSEYLQFTDDDKHRDGAFASCVDCEGDVDYMVYLANRTRLEAVRDFFEALFARLKVRRNRWIPIFRSGEVSR